MRAILRVVSVTLVLVTPAFISAQTGPLPPQEPTALVNANIVRNIDLGARRRLQLRMDVQNLFDAVQWGNPNLDPTSTNFGRITTATNSIMRFFTFVARYSF